MWVVHAELVICRVCYIPSLLCAKLCAKFLLWGLCYAPSRPTIKGIAKKRNQLDFAESSFFWRNQPIKIKIRGICIISSYYMFITVWQCKKYCVLGLIISKMLNFCQVRIPQNQFLLRNQPIKIKFLDTRIISFYNITQYVFIYYWAKFHEKILYLGGDFKQNVDFLPSPYAAKSISLHKKSAYKNKFSGHLHNFFLPIWLNIYIHYWSKFHEKILCWGRF